MSYKRLFALLLAIILLLSFMSCGRIIIEDISRDGVDASYDTETEEISVPETVPFAEFDKYSGDGGKRQAQKYLDELKNTDCDGLTLFIGTPSSDYISPDDGATELSRFVIERNAAVEQLANMKLVTAKVNCNIMARELKQSSLAGTGRYDILMLPLNEVGRFAVDSLLIDMQNNANIDLDKPYFNISSAKAASFGNAVYAVAGDASIMPTSLPAVFINTEILRDSGLDPEKIYADVLRGEWTWDDFIEYSESVGVIEMFNTVTSQSMAGSFADSVFVSAGNSYLTYGDDGVAAVGYDPESAKDAVSYISAIMSDPSASVSADRNSIGDFAAGRTAFAFEYLYVMSWLINSDAHWSVLPMPKSTEKGSYRSLMPADTLMFAIPTVTRSVESAAVTIAALNAASDGYIYEQFVEYNMNHVLRNNDSVNMLDIILDSAVFDRGIIYGEKYPSLAAIAGLVRDSAGNEDWAKSFDKMAKDANKILEDELPIYIVEDEPEETEAPETDPPETKPAETKPAETTPAETKSAETTPAETKSAETTPAETKPAETKPAETNPAETKPAETKPTETKPAETTKPNN